MHVFIDTNILLNFFHYTNDELDALNDVFATHEHGSATVHLTEQVYNEFIRNRENKIKDALKRFKDVKFFLQFPSFMNGYEEYGEIRALSEKLKELHASILDKITNDIENYTLAADRLIGDILESSELLKIDEKVFNKGNMRVALGNPPGKNGSLGDAINWVLLLESVPEGEDIHIISEDGDYYSALSDAKPHPFLANEWKNKKNGALLVYRTLSSFMKEHFDGVAFSFDKEKEELIESLGHSGSFANTHSLIAELEKYSYFSLKEVLRILDAAVENNQVGWIVTDSDVSDFLYRITKPHMANIASNEHLEILGHVIEEQKERENT